MDYDTAQKIGEGIDWFVNNCVPITYTLTGAMVLTTIGYFAKEYRSSKNNPIKNLEQKTN